MIWWNEQSNWIFVYWESWISIEATKICYFGLALSGIGSQPTRLSDLSNLKNLKTVWGIKLIFCFHWNYKKYHTTLGYAGKYSWPISLQDFLLLTCLTCYLNPGGPLLHCTCIYIDFGWTGKSFVYPRSVVAVNTYNQFWTYFEDTLAIWMKFGDKQ